VKQPQECQSQSKTDANSADMSTETRD